MTDLERFIELYRSVGIEVKDFRDSGGGVCPCNEDGICVSAKGDRQDGVRCYCWDNSTDNKVVMLISEECGSGLLGGYPGFFTEITFTREGKFIHQGMWE